MDFQNKTVVVTGGASGIGKTICDEFRKNGANFASSIYLRTITLSETSPTRIRFVRLRKK